MKQTLKPMPMLSYDQSWEAAFVDRVERMVRRDRNHPSVIFWSLGNESGAGGNFKACYDAAKKLDDRIVHYAGKNHAMDVESHLYPSIESMIACDKEDRNVTNPILFVNMPMPWEMQ